MAFEKFSMKALALTATLVFLVGCTTPEEKKSQTMSGGGSSTSVSTKDTTMKKKRGGGGTDLQTELVLKVGDRVLFDFDRSEIRADQRGQVERWAAWLQKHPSVTVTVEGHSDERGTREYNLGLGERRADAVRKLLNALGINGTRVATISFGKERPICDASDDGCWSQNRRGMLTIN